MKKKLSKLLRWETMLVVLLIVLWVVFEARDNSLDAALLAKGRKAKDVFNFTKMLNGMGVYMLYSFMALGFSTGVWECNLAGIKHQEQQPQPQYPWRRENYNLMEAIVGLLKDSVLSSF